MDDAPLPAGDAAMLRARLVDERIRLDEQAAALDATYQGLIDAADLEPPDDEHDPDGTTAYERAQVASLRRATRLRAAEIEAAIGSIDAGTYGACEGCGAPISIGRLGAVLGTTRCVACASR